MYLSLVNELEKLAEEQKKRTNMEAFADIAPWILGFGAGNIGADVLRHQLNKVKNPTAKMVGSIAAPFAAGAASYFLIPKLQQEFRKALVGSDHQEHKQKPKHKTP